MQMQTVPPQSAPPSESAQPRVFQVDSASPVRVDVFLAGQVGRSRAFIQAQISNERVRINGRPVSRSSSQVEAGDQVEALILEDTRIPGLAPVHADLDILFEDEALLVLNKPQGVVVHPAPGTLGSTLVHHLLHYLRNSPGFSELCPSRPGIVHRLDRGTSGVILVGKTALSHERLGRQFHDRKVRKRYEAIVWGRPEAAGTVSSSIGRAKYDRTRMTSKARTGKPALTAWQTLASTGTFSRLALFPKTGRTHQLRVHLTDLGHPIVGDSTYKKSDYFRSVPTFGKSLRSLLDATQFPFLHAQAIELEHPMSGERMMFQAPPPPNFELFWSTALKESNPQ